MKIVQSTTREGRALIAMLELRKAADFKKVAPVVKRALRDVKKSGDVALRKYACKWDGLALRKPLRVNEHEMETAWKRTPSDLRRALEHAAANIRKFAEWQKPAEWMREIEPGVQVGQVVRPLDSVGCYIPGGRFPLPSTLLMTVIPAQVAGVQRIVACSPNPANVTLAAAKMLGVTEFYRVGGAQAIAAMAYGTQSIQRVMKIVGPGNSFVTAAKQRVFTEGDCLIDMLAGPTEACIVSDRIPAPAVASDLVAQAEHDPETSCVFITTKPRFAAEVSALCKLLAKNNVLAESSLKKNGAIIIAQDKKESIRLANRIASEHLTVEGMDATRSICNAGSIFVGRHSAQPFGDYITGPNHTLPTGGFARHRGGLSVLDFVKIITVQHLTKAGAQSLAIDGALLAAEEGLLNHVDAIRMRSELA